MMVRLRSATFLIIFFTPAPARDIAAGRIGHPRGLVPAAQQSRAGETNVAKLAANLRQFDLFPPHFSHHQMASTGWRSVSAEMNSDAIV